MKQPKYNQWWPVRGMPLRLEMLIIIFLQSGPGIVLFLSLIAAAIPSIQPLPSFLSFIVHFLSSIKIQSKCSSNSVLHVPGRCNHFKARYTKAYIMIVTATNINTFVLIIYMLSQPSQYLAMTHSMITIPTVSSNINPVSSEAYTNARTIRSFFVNSTSLFVSSFIINDPSC